MLFHDCACPLFLASAAWMDGAGNVRFAFVTGDVLRHNVQVRMFAFPYPLLLLAIWSGAVLAGDYVVLETSTRQFLAGWFAATKGEIVRSQLGQGMLNRRGFDMEYCYTVNGADYTGHRYRFDDRNGAFDYEAVIKRFPSGSRRMVYFDPANPADSVLSPGLDGCDLLLGLFAIPFNVVTFAVWVSAIRSRRDRGRPAPAGGVRIFQRKGETRVRLADFSAAAAGFFGLAAAAFAAAMVVVFAAGFVPGLRLMSTVLMMVGAAGVAAFLWTALRHLSGRYDLRIHEASQTLLLPPTGGRKEPLLVPRGEMVAVSMRRRASPSPSGQYFSYVPALERAALNAQPQSLELVNWGWREGKARALAGWLSQELGVPFKGMEEETKDYDQD